MSLTQCVHFYELMNLRVLVSYSNNIEFFLLASKHENIYGSITLYDDIYTINKFKAPCFIYMYVLIQRCTQ